MQKSKLQLKSKNVFFFLLLIVFIGHLVFRISAYTKEFTTPYDAEYWKQRYLQSQWVDPLSKKPIGDDGLYAYAGWEYINGRDPTTLNAELPPLGKYLVGISILVFHNQNIFALITGLSALGLFYCFNKILFKDPLIAFLPVLFFSLEPLFYTQLRAPFFDLLQLTFLLLAFIFLLKKRYVLTAVALGLVMSVKASSAIIVLGVGVCAVYLLIKYGWKQAGRFLLVSPISILVFMATYFRYFFLGHSMRDFLGVQKWIINFYAIGAKGDISTVWNILLNGTWYTWWGETLHVDEWWVGWPLLLGIFIIYVLYLIKNFKFFSRLRSGQAILNLKSSSNINKEKKILLIVGWCCGYILFLMFVPVWPRYLLLLLPFLYNLAVWAIAEGIPTSLKLRKISKNIKN